MSSENQCFFKNEEFCGDTFISFHELRHERFSNAVFPGARSCVEIMLLRSDLFYQPVLRLRRIHKVSTVRSFFSRQKASKAKWNDAKTSTFENYTSTADEQLADEENIEDEAFQEQLGIDLEIQSADIRQSINQMDMVENNSAVSTSKRAFSSLENE